MKGKNVMAQKFKRLFCEYCQKPVKAENSKQINHILHIFLTIVTGGAWFFFYGYMLMSGPKWTCSECGSKKLSKAHV